MRDVKSAYKIRGSLINVMGEVMFRVYDKKDKSKFVDYEIHHNDLEVEIVDLDAFLYDNSFIDYSTTTLGVNYSDDLE